MIEKSQGACSVQIFQVDAFTTELFKGNPAAVCVLNGPLDEVLMQSIASEMNLSETAFVHPIHDTPIEISTTFSLRWFTPEVEVPLCGHATLAVSYVLFNEFGILEDELYYRTRSGELVARKRGNRIALTFPSNPPSPIDPPRELLDALGIPSAIEVSYSANMKMVLVLLEGEEQVKTLEPDFEAMKRAELSMEVLGVVVTSAGTGPYDFVSRFFAPWLGIDEDPVTGAAHTVLAPFWSNRLGKKTMRAFQASERGGELSVSLLPGDAVELTGSAVLVCKGELMFDRM